MNKLKIIVIIGMLFSSLNLAMALTNEFFIEYKLSIVQKSSLCILSGINEQLKEEETRAESIRASLQDKLDKLLKAASFIDDIEIVRQYITSEGLHAITFNKGLTKEQAGQFMKNVGRDNDIENVWENKLVRFCLVESEAANL